MRQKEIDHREHFLTNETFNLSSSDDDDESLIFRFKAIFVFFFNGDESELDDD